MKKVSTGTAGVAKAECGKKPNKKSTLKIAKATCSWGCCQNEY